MPRQHDTLLSQPRRVQVCPQVRERGAQDGRDQREGFLQASRGTPEPRPGTLG